MDENIIFFVENVSFFTYLYNIKWMNKTYNQCRNVFVSGNYPVIFQVLAFQKVIRKRRQIHCLHCSVSHRHRNYRQCELRLFYTRMLILTTILRKWLLRFFFKTFWGAKQEENEWDVHIVENLIILKLHYCLHDLMFQTTFLQSSQGLKLKMRSPFIQSHFVRLKQVFSKYKR